MWKANKGKGSTMKLPKQGRAWRSPLVLIAPACLSGCISIRRDVEHHNNDDG
jgi:hypothetical protein